MKHEALTERLIRIYFEIYNDLGHGFIESVMRMLCGSSGEGGHRFRETKADTGHVLRPECWDFKADMVVESVVILELKALRVLEKAHERQLINYLRATEIEVGMLFNFGPTSQFKRLVLDNERKHGRAATAGQPA